MELIQNIAPFADQVKAIYTKYHKVSEAQYEYQIFQNYNLTKSFGYIQNNKLVGLILVSEKKLMDDNNIYNSALIEAPMYQDNSLENNTPAFIKYAFNKLNELYDSICIYTSDWSQVNTDLELEDALVVNQVEFIPGEYPTPMIMTWNEANSGLISGIENAPGEDRIACERSLAQIELDMRLRNNEGLSFQANPFAYAWYHEASKQIDFITYNETAQAIWLLNTIQPKGTFYMYANYDFNEIPQIKVKEEGIVLVKCFKNSTKLIRNVKFIDLY